MPKHPKRPRDPAQLAKFVIDLATGELPVEEESPATKFARKGGLKGGKARAKALTAERRKEIAKKASKARWSGRNLTD